MRVNNVAVNRAQGLYVLQCGEGYTTLGFKVCERWRASMAAELTRLGIEAPKGRRVGSLANYRAYAETQRLGRAHHDKTGYRFTCELHPALSGLEGRRVEVTDEGGERRRFVVGRSAGWCPCHLEIKRRGSMGGGAVSAGEVFTSVRVVG